MPHHAVCCWDWSLKYEGTDIQKLKGLMDEISKKWTFQRELGEELTEANPEGYDHFQGRMSLKLKNRANQVNAFFDKAGFGSVHISITASENQNNNFYVTKEQGRLDGPWSDTDPVPPPFTTQLEKHAEIERFPWEVKLLAIAKEWTMRDINVVVAKGGEGKSLFCEYCEYNQLAYEIPGYNDWKDIARCCYCIANQTCYLIDMPRSMNKKALYGFYAGIETLKNGTVYDDRYTFKKRRMNRPNIIIFTNTVPDFEMLTADRWKLWVITDGRELVRRNFPRAHDSE